MRKPSNKNVIHDANAISQVETLEYHPDISTGFAQCTTSKTINLMRSDAYLPCTNRVQSIDGAYQGGFTGTRWPNNSDHLTRLDVDGYALNGL